MRGKSSPIWNFYDVAVDDASFAFCSKCKVKISRGSRKSKNMTTSNLKTHLAKAHGDLYKSYLDLDKENNEKKRKADEDDDETGPFSLRNKERKTNFLQQAIPEVMKLSGQEWKFNDPRNMKCHKSVLKMMIFDLRPFNEVNKPGFLQMVKTLQPKFNPGSDKYYRDLMQKTYIGCKEKMKQNLVNANPLNVALVLDGWSEFHNGYIGVNIHFITNGWERKIYNIGCVPLNTSHTGDAMAEVTENLAQEWNVLDKISFMVRDSAANMVRMGNLVTWEHGDCTNHTIQLVINDELFGMASVENLVEKCRKVCTFANRSITFSNEVSDAQEPLDEGKVAKQLQQDVVTRWNSTYDMLARFVELKEALLTVMAKPKWEDKVEVHFYPSDWELMVKIVSLLKGFKEATLMLSSSAASISQVIPIVKLIGDSLAVSARADHGVKTFKRDLKAALERRFAEKENIDEYTHATLLDPRYKKALFRDSDKCELAVKSLIAKSKVEAVDIDILVPAAPVGAAAAPAVDPSELTIKNLMKKAVDASQKNDEQDAITAEDVLNNYLKSPIEEKKCLEYWKEYEKNAGGCKIKMALARLAKKHLTPPATSTDVERLFSVAGNILTDVRNRLLPDNVEKLLFMRANMENYNFQL